MGMPSPVVLSYFSGMFMIAIRVRRRLLGRNAEFEFSVLSLQRSSSPICHWQRSWVLFVCIWSRSFLSPVWTRHAPGKWSVVCVWFLLSGQPHERGYRLDIFCCGSSMWSSLVVAFKCHSRFPFHRGLESFIASRNPMICRSPDEAKKEWTVFTPFNQNNVRLPRLTEC